MLDVTLDPAPVDPMPYSGRGDLEPTRRFGSCRPLLMRHQLAFHCGTTWLIPSCTHFESVNTDTSHGSAMPGGPCSRPAAPSGYFWWPETRSGRHRPRGLTRLRFPALRQRQLPVQLLDPRPSGHEADISALLVPDLPNHAARPVTSAGLGFPSKCKHPGTPCLEELAGLTTDTLERCPQRRCS
jgi:hypothetical protein